ncbi:LacI family DNA-binding transcriptional regulator [Paenibacillus sp. GCM10027626]|uniref:LacI family DNA-binding transcriptional regulator n=1 Tax=Paenibacillus sp. GCM10027626 TaxID=3273411 RepID=UPI00364572BC
MRVTMADIAKHAEVSKTLVSRVLNDDKTLSIPVETRNKIWEAIHQHGYVPDNTARSLARKTMKQAGAKAISIGYVTFSSYEKIGHPYFSPILQGIEEEIHRQGCRLGFTVTVEELNQKRYLRQQIQAERVDGMIYLGDIEKSFYKELSQLAAYGVCLEMPIDPAMDFVGTSIEQSGQLALTHLIDTGYRRIGYLGKQTDGRFQAYRRCLAEHGLEPSADWVIDAGFVMETAYQVTKEKVARFAPPEAIFAANDEMAIGCMRAIVEAGYRIPHDVAVIGHDDIKMAAFASVPLSTVRIHKEEIGKMAVKVLVDRVASKRKIPIRVEFPPKLVIRDSCGARIRRKT